MHFNSSIDISSIQAISLFPEKSVFFPAASNFHGGHCGCFFLHMSILSYPDLGNFLHLLAGELFHEHRYSAITCAK